MQAADRTDVIAALRDAKGNIGKAARSLGMARRTLQSRMREFEIPRGEAGRPKQRFRYRRGLQHVRRATPWLAGAAAVAGAFVVVSKLRRKARDA